MLDEVRLDVPSKGIHYVFACHRWLDTSEEDGKIEIEMEPTHTQQGVISEHSLFVIRSRLCNPAGCY